MVRIVRDIRIEENKDMGTRRSFLHQLSFRSLDMKSLHH